LGILRTRGARPAAGSWTQRSRGALQCGTRTWPRLKGMEGSGQTLGGRPERTLGGGRRSESITQKRKALSGGGGGGSHSFDSIRLSNPERGESPRTHYTSCEKWNRRHLCDGLRKMHPSRSLVNKKSWATFCRKGYADRLFEGTCPQRPGFRGKTACRPHPIGRRVVIEAPTKTTKSKSRMYEHPVLPEMCPSTAIHFHIPLP